MFSNRTIVLALALAVTAGTTAWAALPDGQRQATSAHAPFDTVYTSFGHEQVDGANYKVVTQLKLPTGRYLVTGKGQVLNQLLTNEVVSCNVWNSANQHLDSSTVTSPSSTTVGTHSYATLAFNFASQGTISGVIRVECIGGGSPPHVGVGIRLSALRVRKVVLQ
jgi:hypothetical protein